MIGIIGSGSWATALAKIITDNGHHINWCVRSEKIAEHLNRRHHNPNYLSSVNFDISKLSVSTNILEVVRNSDCILVAIPSAYIIDTLQPLNEHALEGKTIISAVKGILPQTNALLNDHLTRQFNVPLNQYVTVMGPCHAEEVAAEKLSYLTFSCVEEEKARQVARHFVTPYLNTVLNTDVYGVQYAAVLKNIYALGAGIAHGLEYGDNFLSVLIANSADEMAGFLRTMGARHIEVGIHESEDPITHRKNANYAASVYLGDLLVTCYSLYSRNRTFGNMVGKGYSVKAAQLEMNMVAEGYNASKCIHLVNKEIRADMPIAESIYKILWENVKPFEAFNQIEPFLV